MNSSEIRNALMECLLLDPKDGIEYGFSVWDNELARISDFSSKFNPTGELELIHLSALVRRVIEHASVPMGKALSDPSSLDVYRKTFAAARSEEVRSCREAIVSKLATLAGVVSGGRLIGLGEGIDGELDDAVAAIFSNFINLHFETYLNSGRPVGEFRFFSPEVQVCGSLAETLLRLEKSRDGIYVCYIDIPGTLDGWFGFFCKSNGNIFSYNERIDEAYIGQHRNMRNGRYAEDKAYDLFPYEMCDFSDERDYKGYSLAVEIDRKKLRLLEVEKGNYSVFVRMLLAMSLIAQRHGGERLEGVPVLVDSLFPANRSLLDGSESKALVKIGESALAKANDFAVPSFDARRLVAGEYNAEYDFSSNKGFSYLESGVFVGNNQDIVDAYGDGFELDSSKLVSSNSSLRLIGETSCEQEFIGSPRRIALSAYQKARRQLADYVSRRMRKDYDEFGGRDALAKWYFARLRECMDKIHEYCAVASSRREKTGKDTTYFGEWMVNNCGMFFGQEIINPMSVIISEERRIWIRNPEASLSEWKDGALLCPITGDRTSVRCVFSFQNWRQVRDFLGCELPKFCAGWQKTEPYNGNSILEVTDPVGKIKHVLRESGFCFEFSISFSKRGIARLQKKFEKSGLSEMIFDRPAPDFDTNASKENA